VTTYTEAPAVADAEDQLLSETFDPTDPDCPGHLPTDPPPVSCRPQPPALRPFKVYAFDSSRDQVDTLRKQRRPVEFQQILLHHPAHQIGHLDLGYTVTETALEAIAIEQRQEKLEILLFPIVRRSRHKQKMAR
jgi:hypothetical protein